MANVRTLGKRLGQRVGQEAIVLGRITGKNSNGTSTEITTTDDVRINVTLPEPLDSNASGYIEVRGTVKSNSTMSCSSFICFPPNMTQDFDVNGYNSMLYIYCMMGNKLEKTFHGD